MATNTRNAKNTLKNNGQVWVAGGKSNYDPWGETYASRQSGLPVYQTYIDKYGDTIAASDAYNKDFDAYQKATFAQATAARDANDRYNSAQTGNPGAWMNMSDLLDANGNLDQARFRSVKGKNNQDIYATTAAYNKALGQYDAQYGNSNGKPVESVFYKMLASDQVQKQQNKVNEQIAAINKKASNNNLGIKAPLMAGAALFGGALLGPAIGGLFGSGAGATSGAAAASAGASGTGLSSGALSLGGIGATGGTLSAAGGATGGLGSSFLGGLGNFATNAALKGAVQGGIGGLASGNGLKGVVKGAGLGALTGGYGEAASGALGLTGAGAAAFQNGLTGASGGLTNGDLKGAAIGGGLGALGGYVKAGGNVPGLGNIQGAALDQTSGIAGMQGATQGAGALGTLSKAANTAQGGLGMLTGGGNNFGLGSALKLGSGLYSGYSNKKSLDEIEKQLLAGQNRAADALNPYNKAGLGATNQLAEALAAGFQPGDLTQDPGYQFRLSEGQKALERSLGARGMQNSGAALKAAQEYGQGLADQTYNDAYTRWLQQNQQLAGLSGRGQDAASSLGNIYQNSGLTRASATNAKTENINKTIAEILASFNGGGLGGLGSLFI